MKLLTTLDIIVKPVLDTHEESDFSFFVPCMVTATDPYYFEKNIKNQNEEIICLSYNLAVPVVPQSLAFHLIGAAANIWPICEKDGKSLLFFNSAVLYIDKHNELLIRVEGNKIVLYLVTKRVIPKDITASIQECLTSALNKIISFYYKTFESHIEINQDQSKLFTIECGVVCKNKLCMIDKEEVNKKIKWNCGFQNNRQHETRLPSSWFFDKRNSHCSENCRELTKGELMKKPTDKQLLHFVKNFGIDDFVIFAQHIGVSEGVIQNLKYTYQHESVHIMFMILHHWKSNAVSPTFTDLLQGLITTGIIWQGRHLLCNAVRQKTDLFTIRDEQLAELNNVPEQKVLNELSHRIGNYYIELGIELELKVNDIIAISVDNATLSNKMYKRNYDILAKWKQSCRTDATISRLMSALENVGKGGLKYLGQHYLGVKWKDLLPSDQENN